MPKLNKIKLLLLSALPLLLTSCASLPPPPDVFVFENLEQHLVVDSETGHLLLKPSPACMKEVAEPECGHGISIISAKVIYVGEAEKVRYNGKPWSQIRRESIMMPAQESYAPTISWIINACAKLKCSDEVNRFRVKIESLDPLYPD